MKFYIYSVLYIVWAIAVNLTFIVYAFLFRLPPVPVSIIIHLSHWLWQYDVYNSVIRWYPASIEDPAYIRDPACIEDPASIRSFTVHIVDYLRFCYVNGAG